jgi:hypothetical protein
MWYIQPLNSLSARNVFAILEHPQEHLLNEVLARRRAAAQAIEEFVKALVVSIKENAEY